MDCTELLSCSEVRVELPVTLTEPFSTKRMQVLHEKQGDQPILVDIDQPQAGQGSKAHSFRSSYCYC